MMMRTGLIICLLDFFTEVHAEDHGASRNLHAQDYMDNLVDKFITKLAGRVFKTWPINSARSPAILRTPVRAPRSLPILSANGEDRAEVAARVVAAVAAAALAVNVQVSILAIERQKVDIGLAQQAVEIGGAALLAAGGAQEAAKVVLTTRSKKNRRDKKKQQ
eukprot:gnl/MRDRNA2_/MRDRNA2_78731_c0_seq2.p1 gnl/MRDRNA2_/MRDRNA2_78731_c0~~gnl/MRDRNA2_/MRDRNA2_78731_c0_seq2.p1  ORF type:complete len:163 (-),score=24.83 gnl/MRDRNA2_/MRDRNA2_78731_c0_seq2:220-708(-)